MIEHLRTYGQQLAEPVFEDARALVAHMGAVQAQDMAGSKWALGIRLRRPSLAAVREAVDSGRIIRTHVLRPTWHYVAAEDVRWMLDLSGKRIRAAYLNWGKRSWVDEKTLARFYDSAARLLAGTDGLTIQELTDGLVRSGFGWEADQVKYMLCFGEADGVVCNGREKGRKHTYALLDERVPAVAEVSREEALSLLARKYFSSHSPASPDDFAWWSGLTATEAKKAMQSIERELIADRYEGEKLYVHESCIPESAPDKEVHLLPPFDEYLISYKDRSHVLDPKHAHKAHNNFGTFQPVIFQDGKIVGNWTKKVKKAGTEIEAAPFDSKTKIDARKLADAIDRYRAFLQT